MNFCTCVVLSPEVSSPEMMSLHSYGAVRTVHAQVKHKEGKKQEETEDPEEEITGSGVSPELQEEIINKHNEIRRNVKPSAANMLKMVGYTFCGEVVFQANYISSWSEVIDYWNEKKSNFKYGVGAVDQELNIYPYTQLIWYNSYRVGCAATYCANSTKPYFYVCQYCPAGNMQEQLAKPYKKGRICGDCPNNCEKKLCTNPCKYADVARDCKKMKKLFSCKNSMLKKSCRATCFCKNGII
ncbi:cysteine-rich venom protein triflin-like [Eublepharis macularius]|uniref:Cysteine-rich venom protein triflin-like n=1 Tax=Eublepharis macularius TaxID=481883 RepID=A0AA97IW15_EUBMA|nr:cysteine-rich venom protein triflin-like [Eublepharis macularius]